jgi:hypothetical protein
VFFKDVCDKKALDQLLLCRIAINHKIELTQANSLSYSLLYRITTKELLAIKEYLLENLHKGFIIVGYEGQVARDGALGGRWKV